MNLKPIEPGCQALVVTNDMWPELIGTTVEVVRWVDMAAQANVWPGHWEENGAWWEVDSPAVRAILQEHAPVGNTHMAMQEYCLMRIDGRDADEFDAFCLKHHFFHPILCPRLDAEVDEAFQEVYVEPRT